MLFKWISLPQMLLSTSTDANKRDLVQKIKPTWCHFMKVFSCSTCFECYYIHPQEPASVCRCIVLFRCVQVYWCGSAGIGWYPSAGWSTAISAITSTTMLVLSLALPCSNLHSDTTLHQPNRTNAPVHAQTEQYIHIQSPAPGDECNNIRNMLSNKKLIKWHQVGSIYSTSKMMRGPINIRKYLDCTA